MRSDSQITLLKSAAILIKFAETPVCEVNEKLQFGTHGIIDFLFKEH